MRSIGTLAVSIVLSLACASTAWADVRVSMRDGRVTIVAEGATVAEILAEWARVGQTKVVNLEVIPRERLTIELREVTEEQALDVLLRKVSGYIAAPRATEVAGASRFDRIVVMPPSMPRMAARQPGPAAAVPGDASADTAAAEEATGERAVGEQGVGESAEKAAEQSPRDQAEVGAEDTAELARKALVRLKATEEGSAPPAYPAPTYAPTAYQASTLQGQRPVPPTPPRPMAAGQMAGRRPTAPLRDQPMAPAPPADGASAETEVPSPLPAGQVDVATQDPAVQDVFRQRRAVETVNPRELHFPPPQRPIGATPSGGAAKPGVATPATSKAGGSGTVKEP